MTTSERWYFPEAGIFSKRVYAGKVGDAELTGVYDAGFVYVDCWDVEGNPYNTQFGQGLPAAPPCPVPEEQQCHVPVEPQCPAPASAFATQEAGTHYTDMKIQPFEFSMANNLDPMQHTIVKYVTRFRAKNGLQDLRKARHTLDLLIEWETKNAQAPEAK